MWEAMQIVILKAAKTTILFFIPYKPTRTNNFDFQGCHLCGSIEKLSHVKAA